MDSKKASLPAWQRALFFAGLIIIHVFLIFNIIRLHLPYVDGVVTTIDAFLFLLFALIQINPTFFAGIINKKIAEIAILVLLGVSIATNIYFVWNQRTIISSVAQSPTSTSVTSLSGFTYTWNLGSNCSDLQGATWKVADAPLTPYSTDCAGNSMTLTGGENDECAPSVFCAQYNLISLPQSHSFGNTFDISVNEKLKPSSNNAGSNCAEVHLNYDAGNHYTFIMCLDGTGDIFLESSPPSKCTTTTSEGNPRLFSNGGDQYSIVIHVRGKEYDMVVSDGTNTEEIATSNNCLLPEVTSISLTAQGANDPHPSVTFESFKYTS